MTRILNDRYEIKDRIGSGGMADVYLCYDTVLKRDVAVKRLRGDLSHDPVALLRFQREANAASALHHPNIVEVYDVGDDAGQPYIVMELVRGITAKELIRRRGGLERFEAHSIMKQLVSAVACAHEAGIIHRDIKPQNILVKDDGTVKIADFGIALANDALQLTKADSVMGSVHYLAPECVRGDGASNQSDIYALGILFYELLTGELPFRGETSIEVAMKHLRDTMPSVLAKNADIPHSFANIIGKATQRNRKQRYTSAHAMLEDLDTSLNSQRINEPLLSFNDPSDDASDETIMLSKIPEISNETANQKKPMSKRKKIIIGSSIGVAVLLLIGLFVILQPKPLQDYVLEDLSGYTVEQAKNHLEPYKIYISDVITFDYSDDHETGQIISSRPATGTSLQPGTQIRVTVSKGKFYEIESYAGRDFEVVKRELNTHTNLIVTARYESSTTVPKGQIISQEKLNKGDKVNPDQRTEIILVVSSEPEFIMPELRNKDIYEAKRTLEAMGAVVSLRELSYTGMSESQLNALNYDVVIAQSPFAGSYYVQLQGSTIELTFYNKQTRPSQDNQGNPNSGNETGDGA